MLELDDIQHFLLARPRAWRRGTGFSPSGRPRAAEPGSRASLTRWAPVRSLGRAVDNRLPLGDRGLYLERVAGTRCARGFARHLSGRVSSREWSARAEVLGDTGANHPDHWVGGLASPDLHAIVILFASDVRRARALRPGAPAIRRAVSRRDGPLDAGPGGDPAAWDMRTNISAIETD